MTDTLDRTVYVDGLYNMRDEGGLRAGSTYLRSGKLYRSDGLHRLTDRGREQLETMNIATVIDLRDDAERLQSPSNVEGLSLTVRPTPIFQGADQVISGPDMTLTEFYTRMLDQYPAHYARVLRTIAHSGDDRVLVHCTAGKDRTGTAIALTQIAVGVVRDDVLNDYALTEKNLAGPWLDSHLEMVKHMGIQPTPAMVQLIGGSPVEAIDQTLKHVDERYGSVIDYLLAAGLTEGDLTALAAVLLAK
ncbi:tyrosine-protein phosphatase [Lysinibacter cavernae]|uniref:Protein-tyrosine phosphatase n=1 Tax=Lysinibacter cavernae TaxID=1640652 RepID=A0A7X5R3F1_9MICO|nr:tyrosine-protein phosphatase [Lysinibacter cavernae]NIH54960.1 protein-tyrosine phosphatase [Lysinibacter cavernae]